MQTQQTINQKKPFIVFWENDCGYGTDYYDTEEEQKTAINEIRKTGTEAWHGYATKSNEQQTENIDKNL